MNDDKLLSATVGEREAAAFIRFANELADAARGVTTGFFRAPLEVEHKVDDSPVTVADRETEQILRAMINEQYPDHGVLGEEFGRDGDGRMLWVLDPIDGTRNFVSGIPLFGTLVALVVDGQSRLGLIEASALSERWLGVAGEETTLNGRPCRASACDNLSRATLCASSIDMFEGNDLDRFQRLSRRVRGRRFGTDCYAYGLLASGWIDLVAEADMSPYDYLALVPVIEGAGGRISDWRGAPLTLRSDGRVVAAANVVLHQQALEVLSG